MIPRPYFFPLTRHPEGDTPFDSAAHPGLISEYDIFSDEGFLIFSTPGHQSFPVGLDSQAYILTGDEGYHKERMQHRCLPGLRWSPDAVIGSWECIEELRRHKAELIVTDDLYLEEAIKVALQEWYE